MDGRRELSERIESHDQKLYVGQNQTHTLAQVGICNKNNLNCQVSFDICAVEICCSRFFGLPIDERALFNCSACIWILISMRNEFDSHCLGETKKIYVCGEKWHTLRHASTSPAHRQHHCKDTRKREKLLSNDLDLVQFNTC